MEQYEYMAKTLEFVENALAPKPPVPAQQWTRTDALKAIGELRGFIGRDQLHVVGSAMRGEEKQFFYDKMCQLAEIVRVMPKTYEQDGKGDAAIVSLHYFTGSGDWFIMEKDSDPDGEGQTQAFGLADIFGDGGEIGYISITELIENGAELDFYFKPKTLGEVRAKRARG